MQAANQINQSHETIKEIITYNRHNHIFSGIYQGINPDNHPFPDGHRSHEAAAPRKF